MQKYRLEITKEDSIRYISHLDYASLLQRALLRAKLPMAYSEGFNPHMKISFASALSLGVSSQGEYADIELTKEVCQPELFDKLSRALPPGVRLLGARQIPLKSPALMSIVDAATYKITVDTTNASSEIENILNNFDRATSCSFIRQSAKKKPKEINVKEYVTTPITYDLVNGSLTLYLETKITSTGSIKASEVLSVLHSQFNLNVNLHDVDICRLGLFHNGQKLTAID